MLTAQRYQIILQALNQEGICKLNELVHLTDASESTIRRDLDELEAQGLLERIHGGAQSITHLTVDLAQNDREQLNRSEKEIIAKYAVENFVKDEQVIYLDAGTTVQEIIPYLNRFQDLNLVTNSVTTALKLSEQNLNVFLPAGHLKSTTKALVGSATMATLAGFHFDLAFIGTNGVAASGDLMTPDIDEANIKQCVIAHSTKKIVLSDVSKFQQVAFATFSNLTQVDYLLTGKLTTKLKIHFKQTNIKELD
ncbi:DeoR/GlpR family DNA-binding transcription regulator [Lapidilactobacillus bayanensis]|uniref:DeoR/GlpR family DNA-binding transcription regulator n=1 Tax=Lapidilactobacillus bayanensis TaxID=2485998 RepID=UPI000F76A4C3|nr:DeoR/GlpR family DNA-binding transcription regulator [Lapidilactobacillus bayanensis]